ncbi:VWA domain-containing protein [Acetobacter sp. LMG 32666]|uniref:VWA domain-containing protein n=1 Tax=Acetobacter sp. LMG 32666 TaxID=2959295 RepID=UPI0030C84440
MTPLFASLGFAPLLPLWVLTLLGLLALALCGWGLFTRTGGAILRLCGVCVVLLWLAGPQRYHEQRRTLPQTALLIVDQSPSMALDQRAAIARQAADTLAQTKVDGLNIRTVTVRGNTHDGTKLFDALDQAAADIPPAQFAGAMMVTDGEIADVPTTIPERLRPLLDTNTRATLPLHILLSASKEQKDRKLSVLQAPPYAIAGQSAKLRVQVDDMGPGTQAGTPAELSVRINGEEARRIPVLSGTPQDITVPVTQPGPLLVSLSASALPGEVSQLNNQTVARITGIRDRLKVLLISGTPNQGERVWRRLLKADPSVDLIHFTILRPPEKDDGTPLSDLALIAFPVRELFQEKINQFDLIILDGFENRHILPHSYLENIASFVRRGGGLLLTAGPEFIGPGSLQDTPVGDVLPAHVTPDQSSMLISRFRPTLTDTGRRHPVTASLPGAPKADAQLGSPAAVPGLWGPWYRALHPDSTHGEVLMNGPDNSPLLVLDRVDQGRIALLLSDQIWLWSRGEDGGGPQAELLRRISHWLMKEPELEEEQLTASMTPDALDITRHSIGAPAAAAITLTSPSGQTSTVTLHTAGDEGTQSAHVPITDSGIWRISDGTHTTYAAPEQDNTPEQTDLRATATRVADMARMTGGGVFWLGDTTASMRTPEPKLATSGALHGNDWLAFAQRDAHLVTGRTPIPLLPAPLAMVFALMLLFAAWWREGRTR